MVPPFTVRANAGDTWARTVSICLAERDGSILELSANAKRLRMYISGDTLVHDDLQEVPKRFPDIDLASYI